MLRANLWAIIVALIAGCGEAEPVLAPVRGRIVMEDKPMAEVIVTFAPIGNTTGNGALGATDRDGRFELTDVRGEKGAHPGEYKIHLYPAPLPKKTDAPVDVVSVGGGGIPAIYVDPNNTPLRANVPPEGAHVDVTLTSDGQNAGTKNSPLTD
jgi:hypothetical protein